MNIIRFASGRRWAALLYGVVFFTAAAVSAGYSSFASNRAGDPQPTGLEGASKPGDLWADGKQLQFIYIGKLRCRWSNDSTIPGLVHAALVATRNRAAGQKHVFHSIGMGIDFRAQDGLKHLEKLGYFDEVSAGGSWVNSSSHKFLWGSLAGNGGTPQIIVVERTLRRQPGNGVSMGGIDADERIVARAVGLYEIQRWVERGAPLRLADPGGSKLGKGSLED